MKKLVAIFITTTFLLGSGAADAKPIVLTKKFANCTELNRVYPGGVSKSKSVTNKGGATKQSPTVSSKVYAENKTKDRDGDGIACEK